MYAGRAGADEGKGRRRPSPPTTSTSQGAAPPWALDGPERTIVRGETPTATSDLPVPHDLPDWSTLDLDLDSGAWLINTRSTDTY